MKRRCSLSRALASVLIATFSAAWAAAQDAALTAGRRVVASPIVVLPAGGFNLQTCQNSLVLGRPLALRALLPLALGQPLLAGRELPAQAPSFAALRPGIQGAPAVQKMGETVPAPESRPPLLTLESSSLEGRRMFDGAKGASGLDSSIPAVSARQNGGAKAAEWSLGSFPSPVDGTPISYKTREGTGSGPARVFSGGLALHESFESLFSASDKPAASEFFLWTRGHSPTPWTATPSPLEADARDLARAIVLAAKGSPSGKAELVLHSFGTLVFQRMLQLRGEPEVDEALRRLQGSRVIMLNATTHFKDSERQAGEDYERIASNTRLFVSWLDAMDATARAWERAARLNPFLAPQVSVLLASWRLQRRQALASASSEPVAEMAKDLADPWDPAFDPIRRKFIAALKKDSQDPEWQEALLRRSNDVFHLEFSRKDVQRIRQLGIHLTLVHAAKDQILNWKSAKALYDLLGMNAPDEVPAAGSVLTDRSGLFRAEIIDADHYFPLKRPELLAGVLKSRPRRGPSVSAPTRRRHGRPSKAGRPAAPPDLSSPRRGAWRWGPRRG